MKQHHSWALPVLVTGMLVCALSGVSAWAGNEGGGGGSSMTCPGQPHPELTDLYELRHERPDLTDRLNELRKMNESEALDYVSQQLSDFLNTGISGESSQMTSEKARAILVDFYHNRTFGTPVDPRDTGPIEVEPGCEEKRVAVNFGYDSYTAPKFGPNNIMVVEQAWNELTPFDRYGIIVHEIFYAYTDGRVSIDSMDPMLKIQKVSQDVRKMVAVILIGEAKKTLVLPFNTDESRDCWVGSAAVRHANSNYDRVYFNVYPSDRKLKPWLDANKIAAPDSSARLSRIKFTEMWGTVVYNPNFAETDIVFDWMELQDKNLRATPTLYRSASQAPYVMELKLPNGWHGTHTRVSFYPKFRPVQDIKPVLYMKIERVDGEANGQPQVVTLMDGEVKCMDWNKK